MATASDVLQRSLGIESIALRQHTDRTCGTMLMPSRGADFRFQTNQPTCVSETVTIACCIRGVASCRASAAVQDGWWQTSYFVVVPPPPRCCSFSVSFSLARSSISVATAMIYCCKQTIYDTWNTRTMGNRCRTTATTAVQRTMNENEVN